ncbi:MAG: transketolase C-terminal domain-containing protein [Candidatus Komeilibacteria bacterium]
MLVANWWDKKKIKSESTRQGFGRGLLRAAKLDKRVVALTADLAESTQVQAFARQFPARFFDVGVAEQNLAGVAAGLALAGKIPFMTSYAVFSPGRNWDQIRVSIAYNQANVKIVSTHAGLNVGADGATHQALEDIALMRVLPNLTVVVPADSRQAEQATLALARKKGPSYLRLTRSATPVIFTDKSDFTIGKVQILQEGGDATIIACGPLVYQSLLAARQLAAEGLRAAVINCHTIKPLDEAAIVRWAKQTRAIVTVEEHQRAGGLGSAVAEMLARRLPTVQEFVAVDDSFGQSGTPEELLRAYHLEVDDIVTAVKKVVARKK